MTPMARNAQALIDLRMRGIRPELPILVSLVGPLDFANLTLLAEPKCRYDWRVLGGLEVEVIASVAVPFSRLLRTLADIAAGVPRRMVLTFREGPRIELGEWRQVTDFRVFDWCPMALGGLCWDDARAIASRIFAELGKSIPTPYDEACALVVRAAQETEQRPA